MEKRHASALAEEGAGEAPWGPSPLWPCGGAPQAPPRAGGALAPGAPGSVSGAAPGTAPGAAAAAAPAAAPRQGQLPPDTGALVVSMLSADERRMLRLAHRSAAAFVLARAGELSVATPCLCGALPSDRAPIAALLARAGELSMAMPCLGGALWSDRAPIAALPRFPALRRLRVFGDYSSYDGAGGDGGGPHLAAALPSGARELPGLTSLLLHGLGGSGADITRRLPAFAARLERLAVYKSAPEVAAAALTALGRLPRLRELELDVVQYQTREWQSLAAALRSPGRPPLAEVRDPARLVCAARGSALALRGAGVHSREHVAAGAHPLPPSPALLQDLLLDGGSPLVEALAHASLPSLRVLSIYALLFDDSGARPPKFAALARAPWFAGLQSLRVHDYEGPIGDLAGCAAPALEDLDVRFGQQEDAVDPVARAFGKLALPALRKASFVWRWCESPHRLSRAGAAALLAAPGLGAALRELRLCTGPPDEYERAASGWAGEALAAAALPALRSLSFCDTPAGTAAAAAGIAAAPWAPHLTHLCLRGGCCEFDRRKADFSDPDDDAVDGDDYTDTKDEHAAAYTALAAAALARLRVLELPPWRLRWDALVSLMCAPWAAGLEALTLYTRYDDDVWALCDESAAFAALQAAGRVKWLP